MLMSAEKVINIETIDLPASKNPEKNEEVSSSRIVDVNILLNRARSERSLEPPQKSEKIISGRVDINVLLERARKVQEKEIRTNLVFGGLIVSLIFVVGIILSI